MSSWNYYNHWSHRNIFWAKGVKRCNTTKDIQAGCYGCHDACRWDLWGSIGQRLCILQKMDQRVNATKIFWPS